MPYQPAGNSGSGAGSKAAAKMSQLKFWNKQNNNKQQHQQQQDKDQSGDSSSIIANSSSNNNNNGISNGENGSKGESKNNKRNWLHTPEQLINGHAVYLVKFFGNLSVDQPKGIEVVKEAIRKLQFAQQMKKAETGTQEKFKKLEITISIKGVAIQEPRTHKILHQFPLYNISYCADEKGVKKFFSFIAKTVKTTAATTTTPDGDNTNGHTNGNDKTEESHECFVFISNKLASDITLTIGQAFDLAYRKFMDSTEKTNLSKAQQHIQHLQQTIAVYKERLHELSGKLPKAELDAMLFKLNIKDIAEEPPTSQIQNGLGASESLSNGKLDEDKLLIDTNSTTASIHSTSPSSFLPMVPPRNNLSSQISISGSSSGGGGGSGSKGNSQKMDELLLNSDSDSDFDPRADEIPDNLSNGGGRNTISNDLFGFEPSKSFGQQLFFNNNDHKLQNNNNTSLLSNNNNNNITNLSSNSSGFSSELNITPPLLAPPPKIAAPRRSTSVTSSNVTSSNGLNGNTDLFGSDPFELNNGPSMFKSQQLNIDDFSLESLDPLRK